MSLTKFLQPLILVVVTCLAMSAAADPPQRQHRPTVRTPMTRTELIGALREGHLQVFGRLPSNNRLAMAWGQVAFENGHGKFVYNNNLGNVGATASDQPTYFNKGDGHWYRHHDTAVSGAAAYWEVIKRCQPALQRFDQGNPSEAARWLKRCNYFEADLDVYTRGFTTLFYLAKDKVIPEEENERQQKELLAAMQRVVDSEAGERARAEAARAAEPACDIDCIAAFLNADAGTD